MKPVVLGLALTLLAGCAEVPPRLADTSWLVDGTTTRAQAMKVLGEPAEYYQSGYILAYRYHLRPSGGFREPAVEELFTGPVGQADADLILVFDANRRLLNHARVALK